MMKFYKILYILKQKRDRPIKLKISMYVYKNKVKN